MALVCGSTQEQEKKQDNLEGFTETFSCQTWKMNDNPGDKIIKSEVSESIMFEEAFHLMQDGWAAEWPDVFCWKNWSCPICQETARLQCVEPGWHHPENKCPDGAPFKPGHPASSPLPPAEGEGCTNPNCDCAEFYRQAITLHMGWFKAGLWYSDYMPKNKTGFMNMASKELLDIMENPIYNQPLTPLSGIYEAECVLGMAPADSAKASESNKKKKEEKEGNSTTGNLPKGKEGNSTTGNLPKKSGATSQKAVEHLQLHLLVLCVLLFSSVIR